jgi:xylulokinase
MYVAGIDCGTQTTKVVVYDPEKKDLIAEAQAPHELIAKDDGTREQKAEWWITALETSFGVIPAEVKKGIVAIGISGQQHGFVPLSKSGEVLFNVKLWNDTSTVAECDEINNVLGGVDATAALAGNPILPGYTASKVVWLKHNKPEAYKALHTILLPHDYLNYYLTGNRVMEFGDASGTGFLDVRNRTWSNEVLRAMDGDRDLIELLPDLIEPHAPAGTISATVADELGLSRDLIVSSGGGDNMMGAVGTGTVCNGAITVSLGTSGTLYGFADTPVLPKATEFAAFCSSTGGWLPLVCTMNCTSSSELVRGLFGIGLDLFDHVLAESSPGAGGIISLPFFDGERTPNLPNGKASLIGMSTCSCSRENILRAVVESTVFGLRTGLDDMKDAGVESNEIRVIGGGSKSRQWRQIVADVFDANVVVPARDEAAAFGAALQALWCYQNTDGSKISIKDLVDDHVQFDTESTIAPIPENVERYEEHFERYLDHLEAISPLYC